MISKLNHPRRSTAGSTFALPFALPMAVSSPCSELLVTSPLDRSCIGRPRVGPSKLSHLKFNQTILRSPVFRARLFGGGSAATCIAVEAKVEVMGSVVERVRFLEPFDCFRRSNLGLSGSPFRFLAAGVLPRRSGTIPLHNPLILYHIAMDNILT
jgi:hypothetical protein